MAEAQVSDKEKKLEMLKSAYALEGKLLDKCLTPDIINKLDANRIKIINELSIKYGTGKMGEINAQTLKGLFAVLREGSLKKLEMGGKENDYATALNKLRRIIYPLIDDKISTPTLSGVKNDVLNITTKQSIGGLQKYLSGKHIRDYINRNIVVDNIFGKRTLFALLADMEGQPTLLSSIPRKTATVMRQPTVVGRKGKIEGVVYITKENIDGYGLPPTLPKEKVKEVLGVRYKWGGRTLEGGFDCSGLAGYMLMGKGVYAYSGRIYDKSSKTTVRNYFNFNAATTYPLLLSIPPRETDSGKRRGHVVIDYGTVERDGKTYHVILQAGGRGTGIGGKKNEVTLALVPEEVYKKVYGNFRVFEGADKQYAELLEPLSKNTRKKKT